MNGFYAGLLIYAIISAIYGRWVWNKTSGVYRRSRTEMAIVNGICWPHVVIVPMFKATVKYGKIFLKAVMWLPAKLITVPVDYIQFKLTGVPKKPTPPPPPPTINMDKYVV